ncbi:peptide-methionine (S)-S-oxide reductase MsrA [Pedobacter steynii]|uniref:Peptide methionine sulfoxide reductase MsrA n=1 Tax=Pedobacter steynii TaxID=430522 RepID=A0A1D7QI84_9SPHI|nr:peptide-methionine (S)-S-oxide reductase MsrA [Pedobacter steynii]AOM78319.1 peptide-methionine (S)-S-oxide reductase [Pedobacter steynii]
MQIRRRVCVWMLAFFAACSAGPAQQQLESRNGFVVISLPAEGEQLATFAGGCFWAVQEGMIGLKGVHKAISGYAGGITVNPDDAAVRSKTTGHAETVQVYYDPKVISFEKLCEAFFYLHDPTQVDRQGPDIGSDYRSIAFFRTPEEFRTIRRVIDRFQAREYPNIPIVTEILPFKIIYPAEMEHQDYYKRNLWDTYIRKISRPKVNKLRRKMPEFTKSGYETE